MSGLSRGVSTTARNLAGASLNERFTDDVSIQGVGQAIKLAMKGNVISAIKYIEAANPEFSREKAKEIVRSFGYCGIQRWPELENWPEKASQSVRCL